MDNVDKLVGLSVCTFILTVSLCLAGFTIYIIGPDTSAAKAPPCVVMGDGRGQKKEYK